MFHYAVKAENLPYNVLNFPHPLAKNQIISFDEVREMYNVSSCDIATATEIEAAMLALTGKTTVRLELFPEAVPSGIGCNYRPATFLLINKESFERKMGLRVRCGHVFSRGQSWEQVALCAECAEQIRIQL